LYKYQMPTDQELILPSNRDDKLPKMVAA
jgi:hypothetical protein